MYSEILGEIRWPETIALGHRIRELRRLNRVYGKANWRTARELLKLQWHLPMQTRNRIVERTSW